MSIILCLLYQHKVSKSRWKEKWNYIMIQIPKSIGFKCALCFGKWFSAERGYTGALSELGKALIEVHWHPFLVKTKISIDVDFGFDSLRQPCCSPFVDLSAILSARCDHPHNTGLPTESGLISVIPHVPSWQSHSLCRLACTWLMQFLYSTSILHQREMAAAMPFQLCLACTYSDHRSFETFYQSRRFFTLFRKRLHQRSNHRPLTDTSESKTQNPWVRKMTTLPPAVMTPTTAEGMDNEASSNR